MTTSLETRLGQAPEESIKQPVVASTVENIVLAGEQILNTLPNPSHLVAGDRVLVRSQTNLKENGLYVVSATAWVRTNDFNESDDVINGQGILDSNAFNPDESAVWLVKITGSFLPDSTDVEFTRAIDRTGFNEDDILPIIYSLLGAVDFDSVDDLVNYGYTSEFKSARIRDGGDKGLYTWSPSDSSGIRPVAYLGVGSWIIKDKILYPQDFGYGVGRTLAENTSSYNECVQYCHRNSILMMHSPKYVYVVGEIDVLENNVGSLRIDGFGMKSSIVIYKGNGNLFKLGVKNSSSNAVQDWDGFNIANISMITTTGKSAIQPIWRYSGCKVDGCNFEGWSEYAFQPEDLSSSSANKEWSWSFKNSRASFCKGFVLQNSHNYTLECNNIIGMGEAAFKKISGAVTSLNANDFSSCNTACVIFKAGSATLNGGYIENGYSSNFVSGSFSLLVDNLLPDYTARSLAVTPAPGILIDTDDDNVLGLSIKIDQISHNFSKNAIVIDVSSGNKVVNADIRVGVITRSNKNADGTPITNKGYAVELIGSPENVIKSRFRSFISNGYYLGLMEHDDTFNNVDMSVSLNEPRTFDSRRTTLTSVVNGMNGGVTATADIVLNNNKVDFNLNLLSGVVTGGQVLEFADVIPSDLAPKEKLVKQFVAITLPNGGSGSPGRRLIHARIGTNGSIKIYNSDTGSSPFNVAGASFATASAETWQWFV